jgi:uncharacterized protein (DUF302 family)
MESIPYSITITTGLSVQDAEKHVRAALAERGFGVLTEIDVAATLQAKLGIDRKPYKILGACNPTLAHRALTADEMIGLLLPCNVVVYESDDTTVVAAIEPAAMTRLSPVVQDVADEARELLAEALAEVAGAV